MSERSAAAFEKERPLKKQTKKKRGGELDELTFGKDFASLTSEIGHFACRIIFSTKKINQLYTFVFSTLEVTKDTQI